MSLLIPVAHDFICPWCWVGLLQAEKLKAEFDVQFDWLGYELFPEELEWPDYPAAVPGPANKPKVLSRFEFLLAADGVTMPDVERPKKMRTFYSHEAVEYAKTEGIADEMIGKLYRALWLEGQNINDVEVLAALGNGLVKDQAAYESAVRTRRFKDNLVGFDAPAYQTGVYNVPTFYIAEERYAERPYVHLRDAVLKALD